MPYPRVFAKSAFSTPEEQERFIRDQEDAYAQRFWSRPELDARAERYNERARQVGYGVYLAGRALLVEEDLPEDVVAAIRQVISDARSLGGRLGDKLDEIADRLEGELERRK